MKRGDCLYLSSRGGLPKRYGVAFRAFSALQGFFPDGAGFLVLLIPFAFALFLGFFFPLFFQFLGSFFLFVIRFFNHAAAPVSLP